MGQNALLVTLSLAILWLAISYLIILGLMVIFWPSLAKIFLFGFAQSTLANLVEVGLRFLVGLAFVGASNETKQSAVSLTIGLFLAASALLMLLLPGLHRRFAVRSTASKAARLMDA